MEKEIWKKIPDFEDYEASNLGNIRSLKRKAPRLLKLKEGQDGYLQVNLTMNGKQKNFQVHRLIGLTFIPNPDNLPTIDHIDMNKKNNTVENLRWCSKKDQNLYKEGTTFKKNLDTKKKVKCVETGVIFTNSTDAARWVIEQDLTNSKTVGYVAERIRFAARKEIYGRKTAFSYNWEFIMEG